MEEAFQWILLKSMEEGDHLFNEIIKDLEEQCTRGEQELLETKQQAKGAVENQVPNSSKNHNSSDPGKAAAAAAASKPEKAAAQSSRKPAALTKKTAAAAAAAAAPGTVTVDILEGPYVGKKFTLKVTPRAPRLVGRSTSKNFRDKGISLSKDLEVSTSHGKFVLKKEKLYFVDTESTNGTIVSEGRGSGVSDSSTIQLEPNEPYLLSTGTLITCGQTVMKVTLP